MILSMHMCEEGSSVFVRVCVLRMSVHVQEDGADRRVRVELGRAGISDEGIEERRFAAEDNSELLELRVPPLRRDLLLSVYTAHTFSALSVGSVRHGKGCVVEAVGECYPRAMQASTAVIPECMTAATLAT